MHCLRPIFFLAIMTYHLLCTLVAGKVGSQASEGERYRCAGPKALENPLLAAPKVERHPEGRRCHQFWVRREARQKHPEAWQQMNDERVKKKIRRRRRIIGA